MMMVGPTGMAFAFGTVLDEKSIRKFSRKTIQFILLGTLQSLLASTLLNLLLTSPSPS
jgi:hypothetical protein